MTWFRLREEYWKIYISAVKAGRTEHIKVRLYNFSPLLLREPLNGSNIWSHFQMCVLAVSVLSTPRMYIFKSALIKLPLKTKQRTHTVVWFCGFFKIRSTLEALYKFSAKRTLSMPNCEHSFSPVLKGRDVIYRGGRKKSIQPLPLL